MNKITDLLGKLAIEYFNLDKKIDDLSLELKNNYINKDKKLPCLSDKQLKLMKNQLLIMQEYKAIISSRINDIYIAKNLKNKEF